jgi:hypothetical protein
MTNVGLCHGGNALIEFEEEKVEEKLVKLLTMQVGNVGLASRVSQEQIDNQK